MANSVGTSTNPRNRVLHWASTTSILQISIASSQTKGKLGKNTMCSKGQRDAYSSIRKTKVTMDYSFLALQFILLLCIQGFPYIALQRGNGGSNLSDLKAFWRPRVKWFGFTWRKTQKIIWIYAHIPMYVGLRSKFVWTGENGFKSHVQQ